MNTCDSSRRMKRILGVHGRMISETTCRTFRVYGLFRWTLILTVLLLAISGCGRKELEDAKQQINNLTAENKKLAELSASLDKDKKSLNAEIKTLSEKNSQMQRQLDDLNRSKAVLMDENKKLKDKFTIMEEELASLKRDKAHHAEEIEEYKRRLSELAPMSKSPARSPGGIGPNAQTAEQLSPCDAVIEFMKASEQVVRQQKGKERTKALEEVKKQYAVRMQGAPAKALKAAEDWVKEGTKFWDQSPDDAVFRLLQLRNTVLDACGKSPDTTGFK